MKEINQFLTDVTDRYGRRDKNEVIKHLLDLDESEVENLLDELEELRDKAQTLKGKYFTKDEPHEIFDKAMQYKSDANPFEESGECIVKDGYSHCENSCTHYLEMTMEEINFD